ncbi:MAG: putative MAP kinase kinase family domain protein [Streblomastix strix]|uniref:non-specific serine/threonine protein kinase n=1 Tax=Streblomastix strix TaxID=222440 RepID=A0A5J4T7I5_9EUKA|nr:MAG: putative MAP kinase kinase family domain protein [Streblomastix strix]
MMEADNMQKTKSEYLVQFIDKFEQDGEFFIVMEYCSKGDLRKYILQFKELGGQITEEKLWDIFTQMTEALFSLHSQNIIHRDLKPENVFMTENFKTKLGDLGMARITQGTKDYYTHIGGTLIYFAPELTKLDEDEDDDDDEQNDDDKDKIDLNNRNGLICIRGYVL